MDASRHPARTWQQLYRRATSYEVVADLPTGERIRLGFTSQRSKMSLLRLAQNAAPVLLPHVSDDDKASYSMRDGWTLSPNLYVRFSGKTEYECAGGAIQ